MRKAILLFFCILLFPFLVVVSADSLPVLSLSLAEDAQYGGLPVSAVIQSSQPVQEALAVSVCDSAGGTYDAVIPAGAAQVSLAVDTPVVNRRTPFTVSIAPAGGYTGGEGDAVTLHTLPDIQFYEPVYVRHIGRECAIGVTLRRNNLLADGEFTLQNQYGDVIASMTIKQRTTRTLHSFTWTAAQAQAGRHDLSVWFHGIKVSGDDGYLAMADGQHQAVYRYPVSRKFIALSLDCAYQWDYIDDFIAMLDRQGVKVTFFMTGFGVEAQPEAVRKLLAHGHELANHSYHHPDMTSLDSLTAVRREIRKTNTVIADTAGVQPALFRPPFGEYDRYVSAIARAEGCELIMWTNDAKDWLENATVNSIYRNIVRDDAPGNIILAHTLNRDTVEALDRAITHLKELGYELGTITQLRTLYQTEQGVTNAYENGTDDDSAAPSAL